VFVPRQRHKNISQLAAWLIGMTSKPVHDRLQSLERIDFGHNRSSAHATNAARDAAAAPSVSDDHDGFFRQKEYWWPALMPSTVD